MDIPVEVWERIIDIIAVTARTSLHSCSLVCRAWHIRSRYRLFKSIKLRNEEDIETLAGLASTDIHLQVVERLTICGIGGFDDYRGPIPHLFTFAEKLLPFLPCLRVLVLRDADWGVMSGLGVNKDIFGCLRTSSSIRQLHLDNVRISSNIVFARFVQALAYCKQVTFSDTHVGPNGMPFKMVAIDTMSLREILGELSDGRIGSSRRSSFDDESSESDEERLANGIQSHTTRATEGDMMTTGEYNSVALERPTQSLQGLFDNEAGQHLIELLKSDISLPELDVATYDNDKLLGTLLVVLSSKEGIQVVKEFAQAGYHQTAVNILDAVLDKIAPQSRLATTLFHTLRKLSVQYGDIPDSLILPYRSVVFRGDRNRPRGSGGCADIYLGRWKKQVVGIKAIKVSSRDSLETLMKTIAKEATIWKRLMHPNIAPFYGIDCEHFDISMICKWMPNGHIIEFLDKNPNASCSQLLLDVARALEYLHSDHVGVIHGNLKGANVLVDEHNRACLTDFGLSTIVYDYYTLNTVTQASNFKSTLRWMAPEIHDPEEFGLESAVPTRESDVYSYSMVMWEVFTRKMPFPNVRSEGNVICRILSGERPQRPMEATSLGLSDTVWSIMEQCWRADPPARPSMTDVIAQLEDEWCFPSSPDGSPLTGGLSSNSGCR